MTLLSQMLVRILEEDKAFLLTILSLISKITCSATLYEEPGETLITLLMKDEEIERDVKKAVKEVFGEEYTASNIYTSCGKRMIHYEIEFQKR